MRWERWEGLADTFSLLDDPIADLHSSGLVRDAERLETVIAELQHRVLAVRNEPDAWWETLEYAAGEGWNRLNAALTELIDSQGSVLGAETLRRLRLALERMRFQIFTMQRFVNLLLPWMPMRRETPSAFLYDTYPAVSALYQRLLNTLEDNPQLEDEPSMCDKAQELILEIAQALGQAQGDRDELDAATRWCGELSSRIAEAGSQAEGFLAGVRTLLEETECYLTEMDFDFLFDRHRQVFHIGYNATAGRLDDNYYDLLASEARIASMIAMAKHDVPRSHWLHLARPLTQVDGTRALLSWSATMFEYLMPRLIMRSTPGTLLYESESAAVDHQIRYGTRRGLPWGISESGYYALDASQNYQYRAFGVPGLGFKRHLAEDQVIAPYASILALPYRPNAVLRNLRHLTRIGALGAHGFYEAVDFTKVRLDLGQPHAIVYEYMAHHQGMILVALANHLQGDKMVDRFHADPRVGSVDLLLQEKVPNTATLEFADEDEALPVQRPERATAALPWSVSYTAPAPQVHYLSNGSYGVLISATGAGFSRWQDLDLTRWRADTTLQDSGQWIYVQDLDANTMWSAAYQPAAVKADNQSVYFYPHMAQFQRIDHEIGLTTEVLVAPDADVEIRRVTLMNHSERPRRLALTSYAEVVMAPAAADTRHPAFNKLFIESDYEPELGALLFRRRPRSDAEEQVFVAHLATGGDGALLPGSHESDRAAFLGRGGTLRMPEALSVQSRTLGGGTGSTLDPVMSLQCEIELAPGERKTLAFVTAAAGSRARLLELAAHYRSMVVIEQAFAESRARAALELGQFGLSTIELERMHALLSVLLYPHSALRAAPAVLAANTKGQSALWAYAISGDYPIMVARVRDESDIGLVQDLLQAQAFWRRRRLLIDLVVLVDKEVGYSQELRDELNRLLAKMQVETKLNQRGGIFILYGPQMPESDRNLLLTTARVVLDMELGSLPIQLEALRKQPSYLPAFAPERGEVFIAQPERPVARPVDLLFDNGTGGFSPDGREYVLYLEPGQSSPAPWVNVLANPEFGSIVSEAGSSCTWAVNSGENRLTPWMNDPVTDPSGEVVYLRDEESGEVWSPTPQPSPAAAPYLVRHGQGTTTFEHESHGLSQVLQHVVPPTDPVKVIRLRLENNWSRTRRLTATFYVEWVLGLTRDAMQSYIIAEFDGETQALLARNPYNAEFGERVAFVAASKELHGVTTDRTEFLGGLGSRDQPAALGRIGLSGGSRPSGGAHVGIDPCAALQVHLDLEPGEIEEVWFVLGQGRDRDEAVRLAAEYRDPSRLAHAVRETEKFWDELLGTVQVETPDPAMDILLNRWLPYQALSCRIWGRSALYQSSGAYGFRDQLQDVLAMIHAAPQVAREQILRAAEHQFEAGDVLHWWHPPSGRGVRTRYSDDLLWLPFVTTHYVEATGDKGILDEVRPFLRATPLEPHEEERYGQYPVTTETYSLFEHCRRSIERGSTAGDHGLPLMGGGDWNDGMNRVGIQGRGESVWLGWFLLATYKRWADLCELRGEAELAAAHRKTAAELTESLEKHAWDGEWYIRAFYDDGTPLGSSQNNECQIDSIAQSWSILSGSGSPERAVQAMESVDQRLVRPDDGLILLFTPPFDQTPRDPGYIKGYVPGIRENGGQYTHAALWTVWAYAELGDGQRATELFGLLNPIYHSDTPEKVQRYKVEPYVIAADVYGVAPHTGRGGWTWYTGSSGWMYRLGLEGILGIRRRGDALAFTPHLSPRWEGFSVTYRFGTASYRIRVHNRVRGQPGSRYRIMLDGNQLNGDALPLADDGREHDVQVWPDAEG